MDLCNTGVTKIRNATTAFERKYWVTVSSQNGKKDNNQV